MSKLSTRVRLAEKLHASSEDILSDFAETLYPDRYRNIHGDPGSEITYASSVFGDIVLKTAASDDGDDFFLFAHYLWNASLQLAEFICEGYEPSEETSKDASIVSQQHLWSVKGRNVLELGAGTGLVGIVSRLAGAEHVTISDYPSETIMETLKTNVSCNVKQENRGAVAVCGHNWGVFTDELARNQAGEFTRILAADCIWMQDKQEQLISSLSHFLSPLAESRIWIVAGFHTGREVVVTFFERARKAGFEVEKMWERDVNGNERPWDAQRDGHEDDIEYRRKWLSVAILKR